MNKVKVVKVNSDIIEFEDGVQLFSNHDQDCCESHSLTLTDLTLSDFEGLEFDLTNDNFFNKIPDYGIELVPVKGFSVKIPAHGYNNGYYGTNLELCLTDNKGFSKSFDITDCQDISG